MGARKLAVLLALAVCLPCTFSQARAWIFHEHHRITSTAFSALDAEQSETLRRLWDLARAGREGRFCAGPDAAEPEGVPACLDLSTWPAIAGDHSCSSEEMLATVSESGWILEVAAIGARTGRELAAATDEREASSAYVRGTLDLARTDPAPGVRGAHNNGHFALNRSSNDPLEYVVSAVRDGAPLNAAGIYARYHLSALRLAAAWGAGDFAPEEEAGLVLAILAREVFALHFLEDDFAAGHVAGCWGRSAERLGTHDYYNRHGLETMTWAGENVILLGDRYLRPEDLDRTASAVRASLGQLLEAARPGSALAAMISAVPLEEVRGRSPLDVCRETVFPEGGISESLYPVIQEVVSRFPMPGRGPGIASLPRSRAEVGAFISWVSGARVGVLQGSFDPSLDGTFVDGEVFIGLRLGVGLDGLTGRNGDGLMFLEAGVANRQEKGPYFSSASPVDTLPGRTGLQLRMRVPFYVIPGDFVLAGPVLAVASPRKLKEMAIVAANGGVIPWQRPMPAGEQGRFQFVLGREVGLTLHGQWGADHYTMLVQSAPGAAPAMHEVEVKSTEWEFPILEYRAFRTFAARQSYTAILQVGAGIDQPTGGEVVGFPDAPDPDLRSRKYLFARITFDVRHYF